MATAGQVVLMLQLIRDGHRVINHNVMPLWVPFHHRFTKEKQNTHLVQENLYCVVICIVNKVQYEDLNLT